MDGLGLDDGTKDVIVLHDRTTLSTHGPAQCKGTHCCVHNPSDHPLKDAPMNWRSDRGLMERVCEHGVGHPDPDDLAHKARTLHPEDQWAFSVHGCDGCC